MFFRIDGEMRIISEQELKDIVDKKLNELIDSWPVVYGQWCGVYREFGESYSTKNNPTTTHKARLAFIEKIVKKQCEHEPNVRHDNLSGAEYIIDGCCCKHCGVELKATWIEK